MRYDDDYDDFEEYDFRSGRHSGLGIASFILALAGGLLLGAVIIIAGIIETNHPGAIGHGSQGEMVVGLIACFALFLAVIGAALGIAGICQKKRKPVFAVLGLVFNGLLLLGGGCLALIGVLAQA